MIDVRVSRCVTKCDRGHVLRRTAHEPVELGQMPRNARSLILAFYCLNSRTIQAKQLSQSTPHHGSRWQQESNRSADISGKYSNE